MRVDYDVVVVGAGPVGCAVARDVAAAGFKVLVAEEDPKIGEPLQCAGLISPRILEISRVSPEVVIQPLTGARVYSPRGRVLNLAGKKVYGLAVDRVAFDRDIARQAQAAGAEIWNRARVCGLTLLPDGVRVQLRFGDGGGPGSRLGFGEVTSRLVIGADGQKSLVARWLDLPQPAEKILMYAAEVELPGRNDRIVDIFLGREVAPGWFAWVIPAGRGRARVGVGVTPSMKSSPGRPSGVSPKKLLMLLAERYPGVFQGMRVIRSTGGLAPIGFMEKTYGPRSLIVGDAACHVKPISGGGLYLGLKAARHCASTAVAALRAGDCSEEFLSRYQQAWEDEIGLEIRCGLKHREVFLRLSDQDMEALLSFLDKPYWRKLILKYGDIDRHSLLARKLVYAPPWAQRFLVDGLKVLLGCFSEG